MNRALRPLAVLGLLSSCLAGAQTLGDLARQTRAQAQPAPVYTNANLPQSGDLSVVGAEPGSSTETAAPAATSPSPAEDAQLEQKWRERFAAARAGLNLAKQQLDVTQRELNLSQVQYYSDPNQALRQQTSRGDIDRLTAAVAELQAEVTQRTAGLAAMEEELRQAGLPAAWGRP